MSFKKTALDIETLRLRLRYDADSGLLSWTKSGLRAGFVGNRGYVRVKFSGQEWLAHILAWALFYGVVPVLEIDHRNRDKADNRIKNLREVTRVENMANCGVVKRADPNGQVLPPGVIFNKRERRFKASSRHNGRRVHLGTFLTADEAIASLLSERRAA